MNMPIRHRINRNINMVVFTDEIHTDVGAAAFCLAELYEATGHDYFSKEDLVIRTAAGGGGVLLVENVDYILSEEKADFSTLATNAAGVTKTIYKKIQISNPVYQVGALYFSGKYFTDYADSEDLNNLTVKCIAKIADYILPDLPGNGLYLMTNGANNLIFTMHDALTNIDCETIIMKVDTGAGITTVARSGADTFMGATAFLLRKQWDFIKIKSVGSYFYVIDSLSTLDSAALAVNQSQALSMGMGIKPRRINRTLLCVTNDGTYVAAEEAEPVVFEAVATYRLCGWLADATNIYTNTSAATLAVISKTVGGTFNNITMANWKLRFRYSI